MIVKDNFSDRPIWSTILVWFTFNHFHLENQLWNHKSLKVTNQRPYGPLAHPRPWCSAFLPPTSFSSFSDSENLFPPPLFYLFLKFWRLQVASVDLDEVKTRNVESKKYFSSQRKNILVVNGKIFWLPTKMVVWATKTSGTISLRYLTMDSLI